MKAEYFSGIKEDSIPLIKMVEMTTITNVVNTPEFKDNPLMLCCMNILGLSIKDKNEVDYISDLLKTESPYDNLSKVNLGVKQKKYYDNKDIIRYLSNPVAIETSLCYCGWVIILGIHQTGTPALDTIILYDIESDEILLQNLNGFLWSCIDSKIIYKELKDEDCAIVP